MSDPFDRDSDSKLYGDFVIIGYLSEDCFLVNIAETAKVLLEQMHKSVEPEDEITLVFTLEKTDDEGIYRCTGAWKSMGKVKLE